MLRDILEVLNADMEEPTLYGWFHLLCWGIVISLCIVVIVFRNKMSEKIVNRYLLCTGIVYLLLEIYKILVMCYDSNGLTKMVWYIFPFQFCSTPMYLSIIAGVVKRGRLYQYLVSYLATYSLFAGLAVMTLPTTVFISTIGINIQTMVVHGGMVVMGVMLLVTKTAKLEWKTLLKGSVVFVIMCLIAMGLNVLWHFFGTQESFNMFYISPWGECVMPILDKIQANAPYIVFILCYIIGFVVCAGVVLGVAIAIDKIINRYKNR